MPDKQNCLKDMEAQCTCVHLLGNCYSTLKKHGTSWLFKPELLLEKNSRVFRNSVIIESLCYLYASARRVIFSFSTKKASGQILFPYLEYYSVEAIFSSYTRC